ncbi:MAG: hypothetical protein WC637_15500, partial [Victivallales bacterium]
MKLPLFIFLLFSSSALFGTDTAFWKPYIADAETFYLEHFDSNGAPQGRFGGAHQGPSPSAQSQPGLFHKGTISMEGWVKLSTLPKERAYVIQRIHAPKSTCGFELFIEPSGAFGLNVVNCSGGRMELKSDAGLVKAGEWVHLAGLAND